jgi:hypothetical protein
LAWCGDLYCADECLPEGSCVTDCTTCWDLCDSDPTCQENCLQVKACKGDPCEENNQCSAQYPACSKLNKYCNKVTGCQDCRCVFLLNACRCRIP